MHNYLAMGGDFFGEEELDLADFSDGSEGIRLMGLIGLIGFFGGGAMKFELVCLSDTFWWNSESGGISPFGSIPPVMSWDALAGISRE